MSLEEKINKDLVVAMKTRDDVSLRGIRAIKSAILLAKTDGSGQAIDEAREVQMLQKLEKTTGPNWRKRNAKKLKSSNATSRKCSKAPNWKPS